MLAPGSKDLYFPTKYSQSFFKQCITYLWKQHWSVTILEKSSIHSSHVFVYNLCCSDVWNNILASWLQGVKREKIKKVHYKNCSWFWRHLFLLVSGLMFCLHQISVGRQQDLFNAIGSMYAAVMFLSVRNSSTVQPIISIDRTVFYRKREAGMYSALPSCFWEGIDSYSLMDWHWFLQNLGNLLMPKGQTVMSCSRGSILY